MVDELEPAGEVGVGESEVAKAEEVSVPVEEEVKVEKQIDSKKPSMRKDT